ncbi:MAG: AlkZ family DNA glycosylase [Micromonosporaceae bacterium]|nr:AlkZ family DNA glycosylase [Micromonosporaceae bacterium]
MVSLLLAPRPAGYAGEPAPSTVAGVVTWFGAMQAQDAASAAWSFGVRLPALTLADLDAAFERGEAIRTWPMRGTVHYVPPPDAHWMLDLMGVRALAGAAKRREGLGLATETANAAVDVLGAVLAGGKRLTRAQCLDALRDAGIDVTGQLGYHLLWYASQSQVTCFAPNIGNEQAFMLLDECVPEPNRPDRDEALATIATRYFRSHGPTTRQDFAGWTGLTMADCRRGIAAAGDSLAPVTVDGAEMYADRALLEARLVGAARPARRKRPALALPGFDEYMLGFKDRSMMLDAEHMQAIVPGGNGMFQPTLVLGGRVVGTWRRRLKRATVAVTVTALADLSPADRTAVEAAFAGYGRYLGLPVELTWS